MRKRALLPICVTILAISTAVGIAAAVGRLPDDGLKGTPPPAAEVSQNDVSQNDVGQNDVSQTLDVSIPAYPIPSEQLAGWLELARDGERVAIADGELTFEEYQVLVLATVTCIEEAGIRVVHSAGYGRADDIEGGPRLSSRGVYSYFGQIATYSATPPTDSFRAIDKCKAGSAQVEHLWGQHTAPGEQEVASMREFMAACLERAGASVAASPSDRDLRRFLEEGTVSSDSYRACQFEAADEFEIDSLPG